MRIESITIVNFRQYREAVYDFSPKQGKNDMHIVLGNNGVGKTNMLNAITWCLYGKETHLGDKNTATHMINSHYVSELRTRGENHGEVKVELFLSSDDLNISKLKVTRTALFNVTKDRVQQIEDKVLVMYQKDNDWVIVESDEETMSLIHRFVPEEINEYIFFDGEQLEKYFQEQQRENIRTGICELTQSSLLDKAATAFDKYITSELNPKLRNCGVDEVQRSQKLLDIAKGNLDTAESTLKEIEQQIAKFDTKIKELDQKIKGHENVKEKRDRYYALEEMSDTLSAKKKEAMFSMMKFTREYYLYFTLYSALKPFYDYINSQEKDGKLPPKIDKAVLQKILEDKKCLICGTDLDESHIREVERLLQELNLTSATSAELNKAMVALNSFFELMKKYPELKQAKIDAINQISEEMKAVDAEYSEINEYLKNIPNSEVLAQEISDRGEYKKLYDSALEKRGAEKHVLEQCQKKVSDAEQELGKALANNKKLKEVEKQIEYCKKAKVLLTNVRKEILYECRANMQSATFDIFNKLVWKNGSFSKVEIDEDYTFKLLDASNNQTLGSCSAAERALLALSFTLALQEISKHDSLLYIDTPIGRVDPDNRENFMKVLLDISKSKQVILTFTPSEYDGNVQQLLKDKYSSFNTLRMNDNETIIDKE